MRRTYEDVARRFGKDVDSDTFNALCPCHNDTNASLTITRKDDGGILCHCHTGCDQEAVLHAVLQLAEKPDWVPAHSFTHAYQKLDGSEFAVKHRAVAVDGSKRMWWDRGLNNVSPPLYRCPKLMAAPTRSLVVLVEGEQKVERLEALGMVATSVPNGASSKWDAGWNALFAGKGVVILADSDLPGRKLANHIARQLAGIARWVRVVDLAHERDDGFDVVNWLDAGGTVEQLYGLVNQVTPGALIPIPDKPTAAAAGPVPSTGGSKSDNLRLVRLSTVRDRPITWLWLYRIALGKTTLWGGDPDCGKSSASIDVAARVTSGLPWPDGAPAMPGGPGDVLLLSAEDDPEDTILPRLRAAGGDPDRVHILRSSPVASTDGDDDGDGPVAVDLAKDLARLEKLLDGFPTIRLIVLDPIDAYLPTTDAHRNTALRARVLAPLSDLARRRKIAVVAVTHLRKDKSGSALDRMIGSIATGAAARSVWLFMADPQAPGRTLMLFVKGNNTRQRTGLAFTFKSIERKTSTGAMTEVGVVQWETDPINETANEMFAKMAEKKDRDHSPLARTLELLPEILADGTWRAMTWVREEVVRRAGIAISQSTIDRAKALLGIESARSGEGKLPAELEALANGRDRPSYWRFITSSGEVKV